MVEVVPRSTVAVVHDQLGRLTARIGVPAQIVGDHGGDLAKGIALFREVHGGVVDTYDVGHELACLFKAELEPDAPWQEFVRQAGVGRATSQQVRGGVPRSPALRTKARYQDPAGLVRWGEAILELEHADLAGHAWRSSVGVRRRTRNSGSRAVGWVRGSAADLASWRGLLAIIATTQGQVRATGLHLASERALRPLLKPVDGRGRRFAVRVCNSLGLGGRSAQRAHFCNRPISRRRAGGRPPGSPAPRGSDLRPVAEFVRGSAARCRGASLARDARSRGTSRAEAGAASRRSRPGPARLASRPGAETGSRWRRGTSAGSAGRIACTTASFLGTRFDVPATRPRHHEPRRAGSIRQVVPPDSSMDDLMRLRGPSQGRSAAPRERQRTTVAMGLRPASEPPTPTLGRRKLGLDP